MIVHKEPLKTRKLEVDETGFVYHEQAGLGMGDKARHAYGEIDAVVRNTEKPAQPRLSIQVGTRIYTILYKPGDQHHVQVVDYIVLRAGMTAQEAK